MFHNLRRLIQPLSRLGLTLWVGGSSLLGLSQEAPNWMVEGSAWGTWAHYDTYAWGQLPNLQDIRIAAAGFSRLSPHVMAGLGVDWAFGGIYQFGQLQPNLRYYALGTHRPVAPFLLVSPGLGWTRSRYSVVVNGRPEERLHQGWVFQPSLALGLSWRPFLGRVGGEMCLLFQPEDPPYYSGNTAKDRDWGLFLQMRFSYWGQARKTTP